jgi:phosphonate transport system substrate-binding protein
MLEQTMIDKTFKFAAALVVAALGLHAAGAAAQGQNTYKFYVLNQRSVALTAQYWNPILTHVSKKSGVPLELKLAKTPQEGNANAEKGVYDFQYTNHFFTPDRDRLGWKVIARPAGPGIPSQIVVPEDSPIQTLNDLNGKDVAFVSPDAFLGYWVPMDALLRANVKVNRLFTGNQEASSAQLKVSKVAAAGVNSSVPAANLSPTVRCGPRRRTSICASWPIRSFRRTRWPRYARRSSPWSRIPRAAKCSRPAQSS